MSWFVYILRCVNDSYYIGHSLNPSARLSRHKDGTGAQHTATYQPNGILYHERFDTEAEAVRRERQLKRWSRAKKEALITGNKVRLHELSKSRD